MFAISFLDSEAQRLTKDVASFEASLFKAGATPEDVADAIYDRYGFEVSAEDLAIGLVWWKVESPAMGQDEFAGHLMGEPAADDDIIPTAMDVDAKPAMPSGLSDFIAFAGQKTASSLTSGDKTLVAKLWRSGQGATEIAKALSTDRYVRISSVVSELERAGLIRKMGDPDPVISTKARWTNAAKAILESPEYDRMSIAERVAKVSEANKRRTTAKAISIQRNRMGIKSATYGRPTLVLNRQGIWDVYDHGKRLSLGLKEDARADAEALLAAYIEAKANGTMFARPTLKTKQPPRMMTRMRDGRTTYVMKYDGKETSLGSDLVKAQGKFEDLSAAVNPPAPSLRVIRGTWHINDNGQLNDTGIAEPNREEAEAAKPSAMFAISINPQEWMNEYLGRNQAPSSSPAVAESSGSNVSGEPGQGQAGNVRQSSPEESPGLGGASLFDVRGAVGKFARGRSSPRGLKRLSYYYYTLHSTGLPSNSVDDEVRGKFMRGTSHWWAKTEVTEDTDGKYTLHIRVRKNKRRRGVAGDVVRSIEQHLGTELKPAGQITPTEYKFWAKLKPDLVEDYSRIGANHFSPEALEELRLVNDTVLEYSKNPRERSAARKDRDLIYAALDKLTKKNGTQGGDSGAMFAISQVPQDIEAWLETITGEQDGLRVRTGQGDDRQGGTAEEGSPGNARRAGAGQAVDQGLPQSGGRAGATAARDNGPAAQGRAFTLPDTRFQGYRGQITEDTPSALGEPQQVWQLWNGKGKAVARVDLIQRSPESDLTLNDAYWEVAGVKVHQNERGRGLATLLYNRIEETIGQSLRPSAILSKDGYALWQKRNPEAVKYHRPYMNGYFSPKRLLRFKLQNDEDAQSAETMDDLQKALDTNQRLNAVLSSIPEEAFDPDVSGAMFAISPAREEEPEAALGDDEDFEGLDDAWQDAQWSALAERSAVFEQNEWQGNAPVGNLRQKPPAAYTELESDRLTKAVQDYEDALLGDGLSTDQVAAGIAKHFGFPVDPKAYADGLVWWRMEKISKKDLAHLSDMREVKDKVAKAAPAETDSGSITLPRFGKAQVYKKGWRVDEAPALGTSAFSAAFAEAAAKAEAAAIRKSVEKKAPTKSVGFDITPEQRRQALDMSAKGRSVIDITNALASESDKYVSIGAVSQVVGEDVLARNAGRPRSDLANYVGLARYAGLTAKDVAADLTKRLGRTVTDRAVTHQRNQLRAGGMEIKLAAKGQSVWKGDLLAALKRPDIRKMSASQAAEALRREFKRDITPLAVLGARSTHNVPSEFQAKAAAPHVYPNKAEGFYYIADFTSGVNKKTSTGVRSSEPIERAEKVLADYMAAKANGTAFAQPQAKKGPQRKPARLVGKKNKSGTESLIIRDGEQRVFLPQGLSMAEAETLLSLYNAKGPEAVKAAITRLRGGDAMFAISHTPNLPMDKESRLERAREMGFDTEVTVDVAGVPSFIRHEDGAARSIESAFDPLRDGKPDLMFAATPSIPGVPQPAAPTQALTGISRIVAMLGDAVGLPIRVGRVSRVPGIKATVSYADSGVGRISNVDDIQQAADVVADHLERVLGQELAQLRAANQGELIGLAREIGQEDVSFGFRQFMYRYVTSYLGRYAQGKAPAFYDGFEDLLGRVAPNMLADIQEVQEAYAKYAQAEPSERLKTDIVRPIPKVGYVATATQRAEAQRQIEQLDSGSTRGKKLGFIFSLGRIFTSDFYRNFVSKNFAGHQFQQYALDLHEDNTAMEGVEPHARIQAKMTEKGLDAEALATAIHEPFDMVEQIVAGTRKPTREIMDKMQTPLGMTRAWIATGRDRITLPRGMDLYAKMKSAGNVRSWVENVFNYGFDSRFHNPDGTTAKLGPGYMEVMAAVMNTAQNDYVYDDDMLADFDAFLIARRAALTLYPKYRQGLIPHQPVRESETAVRKVYADMLAKHPHFEQAVEKWDEFHQSWLMYAKEWGLISDEQYEGYMLDPNYAPFSREMADLQLEGAKLGGQGKGPTGQLIKRLQGSDRNILSPTAVTMARIQTLVQRAYQQSFAEVLENLHDIAGPGIGIVMEKVPATDMKVQQINAVEAVRKAVQAAGLEMDDVQVLMDSLADIAGDPESLQLNMFTQRPVQAKPGETLIPYRKNGELQFMAVYSTKAEQHLAQDIFTAYAMAGGAANQEVWLRMLQNLAQARRATITTWPGFIARNLMLDPIVHWGLFRWLKFPGQSHYEGIKSAWNQDEYYRAYTSQQSGAGIMGGQLNAMAREGINEQSIRKLVGQRAGVWENLRAFWDKLGQFSEASEMFGRVGLFKMAAERAQKQGLSRIEALQEAGYAATDVMNYAEFGSIMGLFRTISPFFGAGIVGTDKGVRTATGYSQRGFAIKRYQEAWSRLGDREAAWDSLSDNEREAIRGAAATTFKSLMVFGAIDLLLWAMFKDDDDWRDQPDEIHNGHWVVPMGGALHLINKDWDTPGFLKDDLIRVPKPFELGVPGNIVRLTADSIAREQGGLKATDRIASSILQSLTPPLSLPFLEDYAALASNRNPVTDRALVPEYLQKQDPEDQRNPYTSYIGKEVGEALMVSPMAVDYGIKALLGPWGRDLLTATDRLDSDKPSADVTSTGVPGMSRFVSAHGKGSVALDDYYQTMNPPVQLNGNHIARLLGHDITAYLPAKANYKAPFERGRLDVARAELDKMNQEERIYAMLSVNWEGGGDTGITSPVAHKRLHPLVRYEALQQTLMEAAKDVSANDLFKEKTRLEKKYKPGAVPPVEMSGTERRDTLKILKHLQTSEAVNALTLVGAKGYTNSKPLPIEPMLAELKAASPKAYEEITRRLEKAHVLPFEAIEKTWLDVRRIMSDPALPDKVTRTEMPMVKPILMGVYGQADRAARELKKQREAVR